MKEILIGVDYGDTRTGLAVSAGKMAFGAGCVVSKSMRKTVEGVAQAAQRREATGIVIGDPVNMDGSKGPRSEKCRIFADMLAQRTGLSVILWDERLTTVNAHEILSEINVRGEKRKKAVDELSDTLILQSYLDSLAEAPAE